MSVVGFIDSDGRRLTFEEVRAGQGNFRTKSGMQAPRALLRAIAGNFRADDHYGDAKTISVTTLINPIQQTRLLQRHAVYVKWDANVWATYGTIAHGFFEGGAGDADIVEHKLVIERDGYRIGGTFDLLEYTGGYYEYGGNDYKVTSAYGVKKMISDGVYKAKPEYFWQAQLYHLMTQDPNAMQVVEVDGERRLEPWLYAGKLHIDNWGLVAISRDWNARQHGVHVGPIETIPVPLLELSRVENYLRQRLTVYAASEMSDDGGLPACSDEETWDGRRCRDYCAAAEWCHQYDPTLGMIVEEAE